MAITDEQLKALVLNAHLIDQRRLDEIVEYAHNSQMSLTDAFLEKDVTSDQNLGKLIADFFESPLCWSLQTYASNWSDQSYSWEDGKKV